MKKITPVPKITRIYLGVKKIGDNYFEAKYKDFYPDGTVAGYGYEDFSEERIKAYTKQYKVRVYNGKTMHGARHDGWRMTDVAGSIRVSANASGLAAAKMIYTNTARVQRI